MTSEMSRANRPHIPRLRWTFTVSSVLWVRHQEGQPAWGMCHVQCLQVLHDPTVHQHWAVGVSVEEGLIFAPILPAPLASHSSWEEDGGKQMLDKSTLGRILSVTQNVVQLLRVWQS